MCVCVCVCGGGSCTSPLLTLAGVHKKCMWCVSAGTQPWPWGARLLSRRTQEAGRACSALPAWLWVSVRGKTSLGPDAQSAAGTPGLLFFLPSEGLVLFFQSVQKHELIKAEERTQHAGQPHCGPRAPVISSRLAPPNPGLTVCSGRRPLPTLRRAGPLHFLPSPSPSSSSPVTAGLAS